MYDKGAEGADLRISRRGLDADVAQRKGSGFVNLSVLHFHAENGGPGVSLGVFSILCMRNDGWDQVGFHTSARWKVPANVSVVPIWAYSPESNPVENLWLYIHGHYWSNRMYAGYNDLRITAIEAWRKAALDAEAIKSVCRASYTQRRC